MSSGRNGRAAGAKGSGLGLTAAEEESCLRWQWRLYSTHLRVIKVSNIYGEDVQNRVCPYIQNGGVRAEGERAGGTEREKRWRPM